MPVPIGKPKELSMLIGEETGLRQSSGLNLSQEQKSTIVATTHIVH